MLRASVRYASTAPVRLRTRQQAFKEHLWKLRSVDPDRWTSRTLASHFRLPLSNVQAMLALQALEEEVKDTLDPRLIELAEDAEEYLDSQYDEPPSPPKFGGPATASAEEVYYDREAAAGGEAAPSSIDQLTHEQELALVAAVATRFGQSAPRPGVGPGEALGAALHEAIGGLSLEELSALEAQLTGKEDERSFPDDASAKRAIFDALTSDAPASLLSEDAAAAADLASLNLPEVKAYTPPTGGAASSSSASTVSADGGGTFVSPDDAFWVDGSKPAPTMRASSSASRVGLRGPLFEADNDGIHIKQLVGKREAVETWRAAEKTFGRADTDVVPLGVASTPDELRAVKTPEFGARMMDNLEKRARRLSPDQPGSNVIGTPPNKGRYVFTEVVRPHKKVPIAAKVWVSEKGKLHTREPTARELRMSRLRVQPPIMLPRIKRNL